MVPAWRRIALAMGCALCGLLLTGCHAEGTFDILSEERVVVDLMISDLDGDCPERAYDLPLSIIAVTDASGERACHVFGGSQIVQFNRLGINVQGAAEYLVLQTNLCLSVNELPSSNIQIRFPGQVVTATKGTVSGNSVHITELNPLAQGSGLRVIAFGRPGPPAWVTAAAIGTGSGVVGTLLIGGMVWLARRRRAHEPGLGAPLDNAWSAARTPGPAVADGVPAAPASVEPPAHTVWAPPEDPDWTGPTAHRLGSG